MLLFAIAAMTSCVSNTTTTTMPDGTVIVSQTKALDGETVSSVSGQAAGYAIAKIVNEK